MSDMIKENWRIHTSHQTWIKLLQLQQVDSELDCVTLQVENEEFPAHRSILSAFSEYFKKMFTIDMKEKDSKVIKMKDVNAEGVKEILKAMYDGEIDFIADNVAEILHAASLMQVSRVLEVTTEYMNHNISGENCGLFLQLAEVYSLEAVKTKAIQCHLQNFDKTSEEETLLNLPIHQIDLFLQSDQLITENEKHVFEFILKWVNKDLEHRKQYFPQLFKHVRLPFIPIKYVAATIGEHELVKQFNECDDLVRNALSDHITSTVSASTKSPRFSPDPNALLFLPYNKNEQFRYHLKTKQSKMLTSTGLPSGSRFLKGCAIANKQLVTVLCGGVTDRTSSKAVFRFDGLTWCKLPSMNVARCGGAAVFHNEKLYVFGGETIPVPKSAGYARGEKNPCAGNFSKTFETFEKESWRYGEWCPDQRSHSAAISYQNQIYLIGGYKPTASTNCYINGKMTCNEVIVYNPASGEWKKSIDMKKARAGFGCALRNSIIYVAGGVTCASDSELHIEYRDLDNNSCWTTIVLCLSNDSSMKLCLVSTFCSIGKKMYIVFNGKIYSISIDSQNISSLSKIVDEEILSSFGNGLLIPFIDQ